MAGSAQHRAILDLAAFFADELQRKSYLAMVAGDWIPHDGLGLGRRQVVDETEAEAMAAVKEGPRLFAKALRQGEARGGDAVGRVQRGNEVGSGMVLDEEAEERRLLVMCAEVAEKSVVGDDAEPALADDGRTRE
jgi:hypothetical protein